MKKTIVVAGVISAVGLSTVYGAGLVSASQQPSAKGQDYAATAQASKEASGPSPSIKGSGAQDTSPKEGAVEEVKAKDTNVKEGDRPSDQFDIFVTQGKITQAQADLLKSKFSELEGFKRNITAEMTEQERDATLQVSVDAFNQWAATQHFPADALPTLIVHNGSDGQRHGLEIGFNS
jgi:hypothetical protein